VIGLDPEQQAGAAGAITMWPGTGLDLAALALIAAALRGFGKGPGRLSRSRLTWRRTLVVGVATVAVLGVLASVTVAGWSGVGGALTRQEPTTPAVAADQARGPLATRLLVMTRDGDSVSYRLLGAEPGSVVRDLPGLVGAGSGGAPDPLLAAAVKGTVGTGDGTSDLAARDALADLGVGFVAFHGSVTEPLVNQVDATAGMTRLGNNNGLILWRVLPRGNAVGSSRLRLVDASGAALGSVAATGNHGQTDVEVGPAAPAASAGGRRLVVAEPNHWTAQARVTYAGQPLAAVAGAEQPTYRLPPGAGRLRITLAPTFPWWRWGQLGLLVAVIFLAAPFGSTRSGRAL
jgi:hypothetical protein